MPPRAKAVFLAVIIFMTFLILFVTGIRRCLCRSRPSLSLQGASRRPTRSRQRPSGSLRGALRPEFLAVSSSLRGRHIHKSDLQLSRVAFLPSRVCVKIAGSSTENSYSEWYVVGNAGEAFFDLGIRAQIEVMADRRAHVSYPDGNSWCSRPACHLPNVRQNRPATDATRAARCSSSIRTMRASWFISTRIATAVRILIEFHMVVVEHVQHRRTAG